MHTYAASRDLNQSRDSANPSDTTLWEHLMRSSAFGWVFEIKNETKLEYEKSEQYDTQHTMRSNSTICPDAFATARHGVCALWGIHFMSSTASVSMR